MSTTLIAAIVALIINFIVLVIGLFKIVHLNRSISEAMNQKYQWQKMVDQITTDQDAWTKKLRELKIKEVSLETTIRQRVLEETNSSLENIIKEVEEERAKYKNACANFKKRIDLALKNNTLYTGSSYTELRERETLYKNIESALLNALENNKGVRLTLTETLTGTETNSRSNAGTKTFELFFYKKEEVIEWNKNKTSGPWLGWVQFTRVTFTIYSLGLDREELSDIKEEIKCTQ